MTASPSPSPYLLPRPSRRSLDLSIHRYCVFVSDSPIGHYATLQCAQDTAAFHIKYSPEIQTGEDIRIADSITGKVYRLNYQHKIHFRSGEPIWM